VKQLLVIFGPPAVGKMTVGRAIQRRTGLPLFHNHMAIEPALRYFEFGSEPFGQLVNTFRRALFQSVAHSALPGLIFTYVWDLEAASDRRALERLCELYESVGADIAFLELRASLGERITRNKGEDRIAAKPSKRDLERSEANLRALESMKLNSDGAITLPYRHVVLDTDGLTAIAVAERAMIALDLEGVGADSQHQGVAGSDATSAARGRLRNIGKERRT